MITGPQWPGSLRRPKSQVTGLRMNPVATALDVNPTERPVLNRPRKELSTVNPAGCGNR